MHRFFRANFVESKKDCLMEYLICILYSCNFPYRYGDIGGKLVTIEPTVYHDTTKCRDERGGVVLTGDLQDDLQVAHDDDNDGDDDGIVHLRRPAVRSEQGSRMTREFFDDESIYSSSCGPLVFMLRTEIVALRNEWRKRLGINELANIFARPGNK